MRGSAFYDRFFLREALSATASAASPLIRSCHASSCPFRLPLRVNLKPTGEIVMMYALPLILISRLRAFSSFVVTARSFRRLSWVSPRCEHIRAARAIAYAHSLICSMRPRQSVLELISRKSTGRFTDGTWRTRGAGCVPSVGVVKAVNNFPWSLSLIRGKSNKAGNA